MRWIFRLIGAFFSFVWRLFWRLVWIVVLLCALAFGLLWYLNGDFQGALKQAERSVKIGQQSIDQWGKTGQLYEEGLQFGCSRRHGKELLRLREWQA